MLFTISIAGHGAFIAGYVAIPQDKSTYVFPIGHVSALNLALGLTLGVGAVRASASGAVHWAKTLMSDEEVVDERHPIEALARRSPAKVRWTASSRAPRSPRSAAAR